MSNYERMIIEDQVTTTSQKRKRDLSKSTNSTETVSSAKTSNLHLRMKQLKEKLPILEKTRDYNVNTLKIKLLISWEWQGSLHLLVFRCITSLKSRESIFKRRNNAIRR